ncbi:OLC1v1005815C1 [Oldenlandia corymbosa var. corymbosa]|uniref:OLC1v1005815C1 n=1 Tax=Oldenlandia corymbosa var. corymbosa TaxID=529605 RepID=A0AAV1DFH6_OLDCO|nr:OLC1v1005815C1 [Oldenlandia corymbosa var. corymbosa]
MAKSIHSHRLFIFREGTSDDTTQRRFPQNTSELGMSELINSTLLRWIPGRAKQTEFSGTRSTLMELQELWEPLQRILAREHIGEPMNALGVQMEIFTTLGSFVAPPSPDFWRSAIRLVVTKLGTKDDTEPLLNIVPHTAPMSFVDSLLEKLREQTICETETNNKSHAQTIETELVTLRSFLLDTSALRQEQEKIQVLWVHILAVVYRVEHLIDCLMEGDLSNSFSTSFDSTMKEIENVKLEMKEQKVAIRMKEVTATHFHVPSQGTLTLENEVVGFAEEAESIQDRLTRGSKQLQTVAFVGMPG